MLSPAKTKHRKFFKGRIHGNSSSNTSLSFGFYGLKALEPARVTAAQIEAARRTMTRCMKRVGKVWVNIFPDLAVSKKPSEVRMGGGKGSPEFWVVKVRPGLIMFEAEGISEDVAKEAFALAAAKLPIKTKFIKRIF